MLHLPWKFRTSGGEIPIAKNQNTFAKRQREQEKKRKADDKRAKRDKRKDGEIEPVVDLRPDLNARDYNPPNE